MLIRLSKIALIASSAFFLLLVVFNNLTDYGSNFEFVRNVLNMSTTFPGNKGMWRAIDVPFVHHAFYAGIILWEFAAGAVLTFAAGKLWRVRSGTAAAWQRAKPLALAGLTLSLLQWYVAFIAVGGEWFLMWQSSQWNGQNAAFRMTAILGLIMVFVNQPDGEIDA